MSAQAVPMGKFDIGFIGQVVSSAGVASAFASFFGMVPIIFGAIGALVGMTYYAVSLYEMATVQNWLKGRAERRRVKRVAALERQQSQIIGELKVLGVLQSAQTTTSKGDDQSSTVTTTVKATVPPALPPIVS